MKMTRLEWRYLQKIALDHPYFDTHELPLTEKEADAIVKANIRMTGKEFVDSIYAKLGMTRPSEEKKPFAWLRSIGEQFTIPPIRKIVISVLIILLLTVFFAATPMGQAIAESVIQYIVTLFDDGRLVINKKDSELTSDLLDNMSVTYDGEQQEPESDIIHVDSFDEFYQFTGKRPFELPFPYKELFYEYDDSIEYLSFFATYETSSGAIVTCQVWSAEEMICSTSTGLTVFDSDRSIYYSIEGSDRIIIKQIMQDSVLEINAEGQFDFEYFITMLKDKNGGQG